MGSWLAWENKTGLQENYWKFLEFVDNHFPSVEHVVLKTTPSVVLVRPVISDN